MLDKSDDIDVIVIGGDHHNTLAVIRSFYKHKINFKILIHSKTLEKKDIRIAYSKCAQKIDIVYQETKKILEYLQKNIKVNKKIYLFPCSDFAAYTIDLYYEILNKNYIFPAFRNKPGNIIKLMNKYNQKEWAEKNDIPMAKTWSININYNNDDILKQIIFPCILKPEISAYGDKNDIRICNNRKELYKAIEEFKVKKYEIILIQKFLKKKYEVCSLGCILENNIIKSSIKKIREYPPDGGGSLAFAKFIEDEQINALLEKILGKLKDEGYTGFFDIEFLVCEDKIYLNEINFRHSGNGYALIENGIDAPFLWYKYLMKKEKIETEYKRKEFYFMDETNELKLFKIKRINIFELMKDIVKTNAFARFNLRDIKVMYAYLKLKN